MPSGSVRFMPRRRLSNAQRVFPPESLLRDTPLPLEAVEEFQGQCFMKFGDLIY